jgi:hypothetical protein
MPCARSYLRWPTFKCKVYSLDFASQNRSAAEAATFRNRPPRGASWTPNGGAAAPRPPGAAPPRTSCRGSPAVALQQEGFRRYLGDFLIRVGGVEAVGNRGTLSSRRPAKRQAKPVGKAAGPVVHGRSAGGGAPPPSLPRDPLVRSLESAILGKPPALQYPCGFPADFGLFWRAHF